MPRSLPPPYGEKPIDARGTFSTMWRLWFDWITRPNLRTPEGVTLSGSPHTLMADSDGYYVVQGGTVTAIGVSRNGSAFYNIGVTAGQVFVWKGDLIQIIYTVAPTVTWFGDIKEN